MKGVTKSYWLSNGVEVPVLHGIDLDIKKGEFVALMGESGGGKSTLMNIIGFLHALDAGEYFLEGEELGRAQDDFTLSFIRNRKIGFIFQQFNLVTKLTALENVALPSFYAGKERVERLARAQYLLNSMGMGDRSHHRPSELSGGQQQRVSIARSLVNDPEIILADEPTGALDSQTGKEVMKILSEFKDRGKTVVMVTHDAHVAAYADRIVFMKDGLVLDHDYKLKK
ncbi:ABC transporter ATP-binding protein [bacterium]|nr:ABC transporter ATP-binding protein [bacterium]MBT6831895.1 ABC transporter ATP-binding protein [bacterium]MBT6995985.1 ABC transporter ATP-binding protein [bacterium]MBT7772260.1 ABC transporter ATP-binding protein [bacterium]